MRYRFIFLFVLVLISLVGLSCDQPGKGQHSTPANERMSDTIHTITAAQPSFRQLVKDAENADQKKFVRITVDSIINPASVAIRFELYWNAEGQTKLLGTVSPFPANNPGSFIIATDGRLRGNGELELRLSYPEEWKKKDPLEVKVRTLTFE